MKHLIGPTALLCLVGMRAAPEKSGPAAQVEAWIKANQDAIKLLTTVKDKAAAAAARPKLWGILARIDKAEAALAKLPKDKVKGLREKYGTKVKEVQGKLAGELSRLKKLPGAVDALKEIRNSKILLARLNLMRLTQAVDIYRTSTGQYPNNLVALTQKQPNGNKQILKADALKDPWGWPYLYDPAGPKNGGLGADIWSEGPLPGISPRIGNWPEAKKPKKK
jgi:hypothetical protein